MNTTSNTTPSKVQPNPLNDPHKVNSERLQKYLALSDADKLTVTITHRNRILEAIELIDENTREYPVSNHSIYYARVHLVDEITKLESIITYRTRKATAAAKETTKETAK